MEKCFIKLTRNGGLFYINLNNILNIFIDEYHGHAQLITINSSAGNYIDLTEDETRMFLEILNKIEDDILIDSE